MYYLNVETIYLDSLFALNAIIDYFLLLASAKAAGAVLHRWKLGLAALLGGAWAVACVLPGLDFLRLAPMKLVPAALMALIAFGSERRLGRCLVIFLAISAAFGGAVWGASMLAGYDASGPAYVPVSWRVLVLTFAMYAYLKYTKHGYEIAVIGESENTARYAGMNVGWIIMRTMFLSGAIAGIVGFLLVSGANNTLYSGVANNAGFTAITVAWLAQLNPFAMVGISALLAVLQKGADTLNTQMSIPVSLSDVITGVLLFFMLGCEFFINYRLIFRGAEERQARKEAAKS